MQKIKIKFLLIVGLIAVFCCGTSSAQQTVSPEKQALVRELFEVTGGRKSIEETTQLIFANQEKEFPKIMLSLIEGDKTLSQAQKQELKKSAGETAARVNQHNREFLQKLNLPQMIEDISYPLYDKYFTENELRDLIAFYKSPTGQKTISVIPSIMMDVMTDFQKAFLPKMQEFIKQTTEAELAQLKKQKKPRGR